MMNYWKTYENIKKKKKWIQFLVQLTTTCKLHLAQGLILDHLAFDPNGVTKHGLTYSTLSKIYSKTHLYLLSPLSNRNFQSRFDFIKRNGSIKNKYTIWNNNCSFFWNHIVWNI